MPLDRMVPELLCANLERTRVFYMQSLGFAILYERPAEKFIYLRLGVTEIMFQEIGATREWITGELTPPLGRGINFQIPVIDAAALYTSLKDSGHSFFLDLEEKWYQIGDEYGGNRQFIIQDPDGYLLRFAENLGRKSVTTCSS